MKYLLRSFLFTVWLSLTALAAHADDLGYCPLEREIVLTAEDAFFPYTGVYEGQLRGFSLDIVTAAFHAEGCAVTFRQAPYNRCVREVLSGQQFGCFNTTDSLENQKRFILHRVPLFRGRIQIFADPGRTDPFREEDFHNGRFSVVRGYTYTDKFDADPEITKIEVESDLQTLALVSRGRADFAVVYEKVAQFQISKNAETIDPAPRAVHNLVDFDLFISFSRKDPDFARKVSDLLDDGLRKIRADGTYSGIEETWDSWINSGVQTHAPPPFWKH